MILALFAERRSPELERVAADLAHALCRLHPAGVALAGDILPSDDIAPLVSCYPLAGHATAELPDLLRRLAADRAVVAATAGRVDRALAVLDAADYVVLPSLLTVAGVRALQRTLRLCESLGVRAERTIIVLVDCHDHAPLAPSDAEVALKRRVFAVLPPRTDPAARRAWHDLVTRLTRLANPSTELGE